MNPVGDLIVDSMFDIEGHDDRLYFKEFVRHFAHFQPCNNNTKPSHVNSRQAVDQTSHARLRMVTQWEVISVDRYLCNVSKLQVLPPQFSRFSPQQDGLGGRGVDRIHFYSDHFPVTSCHFLHFHRRSSKVRYLFSIADRGRNGYLSKEDLLELLHSLMGTTLRQVSLVFL